MPTQTLMPDDDGNLNEKMKMLRAQIIDLEKQRESLEAQMRELDAAAIQASLQKKKQKGS